MERGRLSDTRPFASGIGIPGTVGLRQATPGVFSGNIALDLTTFHQIIGIHDQ